MADKMPSSSPSSHLQKPSPFSSKPIPLSPSKRNGATSSRPKISRTSKSPFKHSSPVRSRAQRPRIDTENLKLPSVSSLIAKFEDRAKSSSATTPTRGTTGQALATPTPTRTRDAASAQTSSAKLRICLPHPRTAQSPKKHATTTLEETEKENAPILPSDSSEDESDVEEALDESSEDERSDTSESSSPNTPRGGRVWDAVSVESTVEKVFRWLAEQAPDIAVGSYVPTHEVTRMLREKFRRCVVLFLCDISINLPDGKRIGRT